MNREHNLQYAEQICKQYQSGFFEPAMLSGKEATIYDVAKSVLSIPALRQWLVDQEAYLQALRREVGLWPPNAHSATINQKLAELG